MEKRDDQQKIAQLEATISELRNANARLRATIEEYKNKEQTISSAIIASMEHANQIEATRKKLYSLDIQRSRLMYLRMEQVINELYKKYPELKKDPKLKDMSEKFKSMVFNDLNEKSADSVSFDVKKSPVVDDPIKKLLRNIIDCFDSKKVGGEEKRGGPTDTLMDNVSSSGFDFNEALHPTMELEEILKVFNLGKKQENK
ncbi:MAG: hypothetical protein E7351_00870 [Clostridiales bacterium]|nr:hypothetical protein [Clostridiales bacterium]